MLGLDLTFFFLPENQNDFKPKIKATEHQQLKTNISTDSYRIVTLQNSCSTHNAITDNLIYFKATVKDLQVYKKTWGKCCHKIGYNIKYENMHLKKIITKPKSNKSYI